SMGSWRWSVASRPGRNPGGRSGGRREGLTNFSFFCWRRGPASLHWDAVREFAGATSRLAVTAGHPEDLRDRGHVRARIGRCPRSHFFRLSFVPSDAPSPRTSLPPRRGRDTLTPRKITIKSRLPTWSLRHRPSRGSALMRLVRSRGSLRAAVFAATFVC